MYEQAQWTETRREKTQRKKKRLLSGQTQIENRNKKTYKQTNKQYRRVLELEINGVK